MTEKQVLTDIQIHELRKVYLGPKLQVKNWKKIAKLIEETETNNYYLTLSLKVVTNNLTIAEFVFIRN